MKKNVEQPTVMVYDGEEYVIKYDFEHMTYILSSKIDDSFLVTTRHYHKLIAWLAIYAKLTEGQIDDVSITTARNFLGLIGK